MSSPSTNNLLIAHNKQEAHALIQAGLPFAYWNLHPLLEQAYRQGITAIPPAIDLRTETAMLLKSGAGIHEEITREIAHQHFGVDNDADLFEGVVEIWGLPLPPITIDEAMLRGEDIRNSAHLYARSQGFPVDTRMLTILHQKRLKIRRAVASEINQYYGVPLYNLREPEAPLTAKGIRALVVGAGLEGEWEQTSNGYYSRKHDVVDELADTYPELKPLADAIRLNISLQALDDIVEMEHNGYVKPETIMFQQKTGRNTPRPKRGFLLNMSPAMRNLLIRPHKEQVLIGIDWSQQEILIAGVLSGDTRLVDAYYSKDVYMDVAKRCGLEQNKTNRQVCKAIMLGVGYGMGENSLVRRVCAVSMLPPDDAEALARRVYRWHKEYFHDYWAWIDSVIHNARADHQMLLPDGWRRIVTSETPVTELKNWYIQSTGAMMIREAVALMPDDVDVVCSHHDAFYCLADEGDVERVEALLGGAMDTASHNILNHPMKRETTIYTHEGGYHDTRGDKWVSKLLGYLN